MPAFFIRRPVASLLLALGLLLIGLVSYRQLPVASLPSVDFPAIRVSASWPGADPDTMASKVTAPLERQLGAIAGVTDMNSTSGQGSASISVRFDLKRNIDKAGQDVQSAINAALVDLPSDMPSAPTFRKANPAAQPILIYALTSQTIPPSEVYDAADSVLVQRLSQIRGVGDVTVSGADQPAIRIEVDPASVAAAGFTLEQVRLAISGANALGPLGSFEGPNQALAIRLNAQLSAAEAYKSLTLRSQSGTIVRLTDIAKVKDGVRNIRTYGSYDGKPAVLVSITKAADANVVETVARIDAVMPELRRWIPADIDIDVMTDRTITLQASLADMQQTLILSVSLVMGIVFLFLGRGVPTLAAGITIPLAFAGAFFGMWLAGFSINNLSLMALAISVGFVVDDAIVVIEAIMQRIEAGEPPLSAAIAETGRIAPTIIAISLSLVAAFLPLFFIGGIVGKFLLEFSMTVAFAVIASAIVALSITPMICGQWLAGNVAAPASRSGIRGRGKASRPSLAQRAIARLGDIYLHSLRRALRFGWLLIGLTIAAIAGAVHLYANLPKGYFPQDDTGLMIGWTEAAPDISFEAMRELQGRAASLIASDPAVGHVGSFLGSSGWVWGGNSGRLYVSLKPLGERKLGAKQVIERLRTRFQELPGLTVFLSPAQDVRAGGRQAKSELEFTLWSADVNEVRSFAPKIEARLRMLPGLIDVSTDLDTGSLQVNVAIDRDAAARMGVSIASIDAALNNAFSQRQIVTIFAERNQYRVVMATAPRDHADPSAIDRVFVTSNAGKQLPLATLVTHQTGLGALTIAHQGQYPAATVSFGLKPGFSLGETTDAIRAAIAQMHLPETLHADFAGDAASFRDGANSQTIVILSALLTIYILLGVLYESFLHPLTILSTLPSAGLGALLALKFGQQDLTIVALIGIILLIGIVKKNGIMLVDRALEAQLHGVDARTAILLAARERFRPILMTTLAAMLGALPLLLGEGPGAELRRPLGVTIIGGLALSQILTFYTTPAIYLMFERLRGRFAAPQPQAGQHEGA